MLSMLDVLLWFFCLLTFDDERCNFSIYLLFRTFIYPKKRKWMYDCNCIRLFHLPPTPRLRIRTVKTKTLIMIEEINVEIKYMVKIMRIPIISLFSLQFLVGSENTSFPLKRFVNRRNCLAIWTLSRLMTSASFLFSFASYGQQMFTKISNWGLACLQFYERNFVVIENVSLLNALLRCWPPGCNYYSPPTQKHARTWKTF